MINVVALQGAAIPGAGSVFYLQIEGPAFTGKKDVEIHVGGEVAAYVQTVIQAGLLCIVKGKYVPDALYIEGETVSFLRDKKNIGDKLWE
jgi:hypothetical protein